MRGRGEDINEVEEPEVVKLMPSSSKSESGSTRDPRYSNLVDGPGDVSDNVNGVA